jgi:holo-[acyl-carrier protein] synthase
VIGGAGIDVTPVARMARWMSDHGARLGDVFTPAERAFCDGAAGEIRSARYAAAFAAKEAVMKALGTGWRSDVQWVHIDTPPAGRSAAAELTGHAAAVAAGQGIARVLVATALVRGAAIATAIAERHA